MKLEKIIIPPNVVPPRISLSLKSKASDRRAFINPSAARMLGGEDTHYDLYKDTDTDTIFLKQSKEGMIRIGKDANGFYLGAFYRALFPILGEGRFYLMPDLVKIEKEDYFKLTIAKRD